MKRNRLILLALALMGLLTAQKVCAQTGSWPIHDPATMGNSIFYLYNVGAKKFLDKGKNWGTQACLGDGLQITLESNGDGYNMKTSLGYIEYMNGKNSTHDVNNFYVDRSLGTSPAGVFTFTKSTATGYENVYTITVKNDYGTDDIKGDLYLVAQDGIVTPVISTAAPEEKTDYYKWVIVTYSDLLRNFATTEATNTKPAVANFAIQDRDFARNDGNINHWYYPTSSSYSSLQNNIPSPSAEPMTPSYAQKYYYKGRCAGYGWLKHPAHDVATVLIDSYKGPTYTETCPQNKNATITYTFERRYYHYYVGNGYNNDDVTTITKDEDGKELSPAQKIQKPHGGDWTANLHGVNCKIYQTIDLTSDDGWKPGWYKIGCLGFSNDQKGKLFARVGTADTTKISDTYQEVVFSMPDAVPETYVMASRTLRKEDIGMQQSVLVYVKELDSQITFGAKIEDGTDESWTCVDNFTFEYCGNSAVEEDLFLSEEETDVAYINLQKDADYSHTLRLKRSFKENVWNSLVLPVNLTTQQVLTAFGGNTKLSMLTDTDNSGLLINFTKKDLTEPTDIVIEAGKLYIIKPQVVMPENSETKSKVLSVEGGDDITIDLGNTYYTINQVTLNQENDWEDTVSEKIVTSVEDYGIKFVGTFVTKGESTNDNSVSDKAPIPANSYVLSGGKWYYSNTPVNKVKGFRGWLETGKAASDVKIFINGVEEGEATAIEGVRSDSKVSAVSGNIYNLNGQLVRSNSVSAEGLDKGIYIIGGKKVVVK